MLLTRPPKSWTLLPLGESDHADTPHYDDQSQKLFSTSQMKPTYFLDQDELLKHVGIEGGGDARVAALTNSMMTGTVSNRSSSLRPVSAFARLFVVLTIACVSLGIWADRAAKQRRAVEMIRRVAGRTIYRDQVLSEDPFPAFVPDMPSIENAVVQAIWRGRLLAIAELRVVQCHRTTRR